MLCNVTRFDLECSDKFLTINLQNTRQAGKYLDDQGKMRAEYKRICQPPYSSLCLTIEEAYHAIECLRGESRFYPWYDDGIHKVKCTPSGIRELYTSSYIYPKDCDGMYQEFWFTLPGEWIAGQIIKTLQNRPVDDKGPRYTYSADARILFDLAVQFGPSIEYDYAPDVKEHIADDLKDTRQTGLENCLSGLQRIAINHSDGIPAVVHLRFDSWQTDNEIPVSYYWWITATNARGTEYQVMNGGIIAHNDHSQDEVESWKYSTHT